MAGIFGIMAKGVGKFLAGKAGAQGATGLLGNLGGIGAPSLPGAPAAPAQPAQPAQPAAPAQPAGGIGGIMNAVGQFAAKKAMTNKPNGIAADKGVMGAIGQAMPNNNFLQGYNAALNQQPASTVPAGKNGMSFKRL